MSVSQLLWDYGDIALYRELTGPQLQSILDGLMHLEGKPNVNVEFIDLVYNRITEVLQLAAHNSIPSYRKKFLKFWWDNELDDLKARSVDPCIRCGRLLVGRAEGQFSTNRPIDGTNLPGYP